MYMRVLTLEQVWRQSSSMVFFSAFPDNFLRSGPSVNLELAVSVALAGQCVFRIFLSIPALSLVLWSQGMSHLSNFSHGG